MGPGGRGLKGGRQRRGRKTLLEAVAVERREKALGRPRLEIVPDAIQLTLGGFIAGNVEPGSTIISDAWPGYDALEPTSCTCGGVRGRVACGLVALVVGR